MPGASDQLESPELRRPTRLRAIASIKDRFMTTSQDKDRIYIGIDLGGTTLKGALVSSSGEVLQENRIDTEQQSSERLFGQLVEAVATLRADKRVGNRVAGIGI